jgi:outer membrane lipoprotein-sorting protein
MRLIRLLTVALFGLALVGATFRPGLAAEAAKLTDDQVKAVQELNDYINGVKYMRGEFSQISPSGKLARGVFFISKPGKMRFEYAPPVPLMIVSDGKWVMIKNKNKENGDAGPLSKTPLRIVLANNVNLLKDAKITNVDDADGLTSVTLEDNRDSFDGGQLILAFDRARNALQQWVVIDGKGRRTTVTLENVVVGEPPDPKLFVVKFTPRYQGSNK